MRDLGESSLAQVEDAELAEQLAASRLECLELRIALSALCEAIESWGQWTMSRDLLGAHHSVSMLLAKRGLPKAGL